jgi:carbon monoxide dehydrogenase subunit G
MKIKATQIIPAPRALVWKGLNNPKVLQQCITGCEEFVATSPTAMRAKVVIKLGPLKVTFSGSYDLSDVKPPESCHVSGRGQGGLAGFASAEAFVKLIEIDANQTQMDYEVEAQIGGKLAVFGQRLIGSATNALASRFFEKFVSVIKAEERLEN